MSRRANRHIEHLNYIGRIMKVIYLQVQANPDRIPVGQHGTQNCHAIEALKATPNRDGGNGNVNDVNDTIANEIRSAREQVGLVNSHSLELVDPAQNTKMLRHERIAGIKYDEAIVRVAHIDAVVRTSETSQLLQARFDVVVEFSHGERIYRIVQ